jgi:hypothetical protein
MINAKRLKQRINGGVDHRLGIGCHHMTLAANALTASLLINGLRDMESRLLTISAIADQINSGTSSGLSVHPTGYVGHQRATCLSAFAEE